MANYYTENVIFVDTDNYSLDAQVTIQAIKYIGNTDGSIQIRKGTTAGGQILWQETGANNSTFEGCIRSKEGIFVDVANGASVYIYLK